MNMPDAEYLGCFEAGRVPPLPPASASPNGTRVDLSGLGPYEQTHYHFREQLRLKHGLWHIVDRAWVSRLAAYLHHPYTRPVLEIMSGSGWLARALIEQGIPVRATDNFSWARPRGGPFAWQLAGIPMWHMDALEAVTRFGPESSVLLCAWPYMDNTFAQACRLWGTTKPIIYIGEGSGGCTADDDFHQHFREDEEAGPFGLLSWPGIHDRVHVGYWNETRIA